MSCTTTDQSAFTPRLLATAVGVALSGLSAAQLAQADEPKGDALVLDAVNVTGKTIDETSYQVEQVQSSKYTAPLIDTPRSVTVVPQQVLKDTNALSLQDALRTVPGITMGAGEGGNPQGDRPFIRGFDSQGSLYLDGVRDTGAQTREIFAVESVEVAKGPNSAIGGRGAAGGTINLVSKKAHLGESFDGGFTWGSDQTQRYTLDGNYQFTDSAAGRLNLMSHESNVAGRDKVNYDRWGIAPSLAFGLGTPTRLNLDFYHVESNDLPDSGIPYGYTPGVVDAKGNPIHTSASPDKPVDGGDSSNFYGLTDRDFFKTRADIATIAIEHDLNDALTVKNTLRHGSTLQDYVLTQPDDSAGNVLKGGVWRRANSRVSNTTTTTNQTDLFGEVFIGGFKNSFSTGIELSRETSEKQGYNVSPNDKISSCVGPSNGGNCTSLSNPNPDDAWAGTVTRDYVHYVDTTGTTQAAYVTNTLELDPQWLVNMGLRFDHFETKAKSVAAVNKVDTYTNISDTSDFFTGQLGLVFKPADNGSIYVSYATSATPPGAALGESVDSNGLVTGTTQSDLQPEETANYELGTKWDLLSNRLSLTAAVFRTEKDNARVLVQNNSYENVGKTRVDGLELTASGKLTGQWQVFAGYSYLDSEQVDGGADGDRSGKVTNQASLSNGNQLPNTPNHSFTLWTTYDVSDKFTVGGGAFYVDEVFGNVANTVMVDSYWRYDAMASYKLSKNVDLQLNVQNLTDEVYYDKAYSSHFANQAAGRTALLSTNVHF